MGSSNYLYYSSVASFFLIVLNRYLSCRPRLDLLGNHQQEKFRPLQLGYFLADAAHAQA